MKIHQEINQTPVFSQVFIVILATIVGLLVASLTGSFLAAWIYHLNPGDINPKNVNPEIVPALKFLQVYAVLFTFLPPAYMLSHYMKRSFLHLYDLKKWPLLHSLVLATVIFIAVVPFNEWLISFNEAMKLPESLKSLEQMMRDSEDLLAKQIEAFLVMNNIGDLLLNLLIVALLPGVLEELFFRGIIQGILHRWLKNGHVAVIVTALFFSAIHFQFYGFLPRVVLGLILGYLYLYTKNLWVAIYFHILNNLVSVVASYLIQHNLIDQQNFEHMNNSNYVIIISFAITAALLLLLASYYSKKRAKKEIDWVSIFSTNIISEAEILKGKLENEGINTV
ncbi:lysostaphin resistance A-like protein, partial [Bacteroidota bacterium]